MLPALATAGPLRFCKTLKAGAKQPFQPVALGHDDLAFLQYTGGTSGQAKGAMLSHGNILANLLQAHVWVGSRLRWGDEFIVTALPLYRRFRRGGEDLCGEAQP